MNTETQKDANLLVEIYERLYAAYGPQGWWPGNGPLDVVIGAILTQAASWSNVELAIAQLKAHDCWSLAAIHAKPEGELAEIIRSSGYFNAKARKLKAFAAYVCCQYGGDLEAALSGPTRELRRELLSLYGIGPETADDILVYAAGRSSFVIDAYTQRVLTRMGISPVGKGDGYHNYQALFHAALPEDANLFNEYHALLDRHAKETCAKVPLCSGCCLKALCATGRSTTGEQP
jgi:endonuclease-3 related protein